MSEPAFSDLLKKCVVRISAAESSASGVLVAPGRVLTCAHVVAESVVSSRSTVQVGYQGRWYSGRVLDLTQPSGHHIYPYPDLAIVKVDLPQPHLCAWICDTPLTPRADLTPCGHDQTYGEVRFHSATGIFAGVSGGEEEAFYRFTGDELAEGMSGGPVLVDSDGAVIALVKATRAEGTDLGGLLTPMRGLWTLPGGAELWREHDLFHGREREWTKLRERLGQRSEFAGILKPSAEIRLLSILARLLGELPSGTSGVPLRSEIQNLAQQQISSSSVHPLLQRTWRLAQQTEGTELGRELERWTLLAAGRLHPDGLFEDWLREAPREAPHQPPVRRPERRALLLGRGSFGAADANPVDALAASLADPDAGHFATPGEPDSYRDPDVLGQIPEFISSSAPSDVLLLYLAGGLEEVKEGHDLILNLSARPAETNNRTAFRAGERRTVEGQGLSLRALADATAGLDDQSSLIILIDYFRLPDASTDVPAAVQRCWSRSAGSDAGLIVLGLERRSYGRFMDLASLARAVIRGEQRERKTGEAVPVQDLADLVGETGPGGGSLVLDMGFNLGLALAHEPLTEAQLYIRDVLAPARTSGLTEDIRIRYRLSETSDPGIVAREMRATIQLWRSLSATTREHRTIARRLLREHDEVYQTVLAAAEAGQAADLRNLLWRYSRLAGDVAGPPTKAGEVVERVRAFAGLSGILTPEDRDFLIQTHGRDDVAGALRQSDVRVEKPPELPVIPAVPGLPEFSAWLRRRGQRHLFDLMLGREPRPAVPAGLLEKTPASPGNEAHLGLTPRTMHDVLPADLPPAVRTAAEPMRTLNAAGLRSVALYQIATQLRALPDGRGEDDLLRSARDLGLADKDARLLCFAITRELKQSSTVRRIVNLIDENRVCAAHDALSRLQPGPGTCGRELALKVLGDQRAKARTTLSRARNEKDPDRAWAMLGEAEALAGDLEGVAEARHELPPLPPARVEVGVDPETNFVLVSWEASATTTGEVRYQVRCHEGARPTARQAMGRVVEEETPALTAEDLSAPNNLPLWYSVIAVRSGARSSVAVAATARFRRPRVDNVSVQLGDGEVLLRWQTPEGAAFVEVHRSDGHSAPQPVASRDSDALDKGLANGTEYQYQLAAVYLTADGQQIRSRIKRVPAIPQRPLPQHGPVSVREAPDDDGMLEIHGSPKDGSGWLLIASREPLHHPAGHEVARSGLSRLGEVLQPLARAGLPPLIHAPDTDTVFTIAAVEGGRTRIGAETVWGPVPPIEGLKAVRRGGQLEVFWHQTRGRGDLSFTIELVNQSGGLLDQKNFNVGQYDTEWPLRLPAEDGPMRLNVTPRRKVCEGVVSAGRTQVRQVVARPTVSYVIRQLPEGRMRRRSGPAEVTLTLESGEPLTLEQLSITVKLGDIHPLTYEEKRENGLSKWIEGLVMLPGTPVKIALGRGRGTYRLRCFAPGSEVELLHPPVSQRSIRWPE